MAEASRSRVTITLGRNGQVVKRAGHAVDDIFFPNSEQSIGSKRSVRDRLGSNFDSSAQSNRKRQRQDGSGLSLRGSVMMDDVSLGKDDLRFKLRRKNTLDKNQNNGHHYDGDLRNMLSRPAYSSTTSLGTQHRMHELEDTRWKFSGVRDERQQMPEPRTARPLVQLTESRHLRSESNGSSILGHIPSRRSDALPRVDSLRNSYSPWTLDSLRRRSPGTSRALSPPRRNKEPQGRHLHRAYDDSKATSYIGKDGFELLHPLNHAAYSAKNAGTAEPAKSMVPVHAPKPPPVGLVQKSLNTVDDNPSVDSFLHSLGLEKYAINFKAEEVDMYALRQMGDNDLKELGIPMGPRKKILLTLLSHAKRQM